MTACRFGTNLFERNDDDLEGLDEIGTTMSRGERIDGFETGQRQNFPWLYRAA